MSDVRDYLETHAGALGALRRSHETHPAILALVREFEAGGGFYDDDAERFIETRIGDLPEHRYHGHPERDPLTDALATAIYNAKLSLRDEAASERLAALLAEGYVPLAEATIEEGARYDLRFGMLYCGRSVPDYPPEAWRVRAKRDGERFFFLPHRARTHGFAWPSGPALIRSGA